ncbi:hypothetical protein GALL_437960 [mine drainage metagenome]|uniref:Uncharacterized protein n=1 Tax=mine drainage metagenome TaxID=410659 RepID=A0A1J5Q3I3_9ZZZZ
MARPQGAVARHRGAQADTACVSAPGQGAAGVGGSGQRRGDPGHHLAFQAGSGDGGKLLVKPAENSGIAALEADHEAVFPSMPHELGIDHLLLRAAAKPAFADVDPERPRGQTAKSGINQGVDQHDVGPGEQARSAQGDQVHRTRPGANESDAPHHRPPA